MLFPSHIVLLYPFLFFRISLSSLIFSLFPVDIFSFCHCECHRKWVHAQLSAGLISTGLKHKCKIVFVSRRPWSSLCSLCLSPGGFTFRAEAELDSLVFQKMPWLCKQPEATRHLKEVSISSWSFREKQQRPHSRTFHCFVFLRFMRVFF